MKSTKDIAEELGVPKQKVYRYIKDNHIIEVLQEGQKKLYDDAVADSIKSAFTDSEPLHEPHHKPHHEAVSDAVLKQYEHRINDLQAQVDFLKTQLETKDRQLEQEQALHLLTATRLKELEDKTQDMPKEEKKKRWQFWKVNKTD